MKKRHALMLLCFFVACTIFAQSVRLFTNERDLSNSLITDLYQDRKGFMWISTEDGLNCFDGFKMKIYRHVKGDEHSLPGSFVELVRQTKEGDLLVACKNGLALYDHARDNFTKISLDSFAVNPYVRCVMQREDGSILVGTSGYGVFVLQLGENIASEPMASFTESGYILDLCEDRHRDLWIVTENKGVYRIAADGKKTCYLGDDTEPLRHSFNCIAEDKNGVIYAGNRIGGVFRYDRKTDCFVRVASCANCPVAALLVSKDNKLMIGTDGEGLKLYDADKEMVENVSIHAGSLILDRMKIHCLTQDYSGNLWLGVYQKGVALCPERSHEFKYLGNTSFPHNVWQGGCVTALCKDSEGKLWVGTDNDGAYRWNMDNLTSTHFIHSATDSHSVPATVLSVFCASDGTLWMGSYQDELCTMDIHTGKVRKISELLPERGAGITRVFAITEDRYRRLWFATMGQGIWSLDMGTHEMRHIDVCPEAAIDLTVDGLPSEWIYDVLASKDDKLYIATSNGVACMNLKTGSFLFPSGENRICRETIIYTLHEDQDGMIWIGGINGLNRYDPATGKSATFTTEDSMPNNVVCGIEEGNDGCLWVSTYYGVARMDKDGHVIRNYYYSDGLQGNEFHFSASYKDKNGDLYFGGLNGVSYFTPTRIVDEQKTIDITLTGFYIHGNPVTLGTKSGRYDVVKCAVDEADRFEMSYEDNSFTLEFSSLSFIDPSLITYVYSLDDEPWVALPTGVNQVSFSNLNAGKHSFKVKVEGYNFKSEVRAYTIIVHEVWYLSGWAYLGYVCLCLFIIGFIFYYYRMRHIEAMKLKESEHVKELNEAKLRFFINISHEIRTPLTLIISPLEKLLGMDDDEKHRKIYRMMHRNSNRILQLINQLMDIRKLDKGQMRLNFSEVDMVGFLENLHELFQSAAEPKRIRFTFTHDMEKLPVWVDVQNFDKIVMNILTNAFKFTPEDGMIDITLRTGTGEENDTTPLSHYFEIRVTDSGFGISDDEKQRIFERFYQLNNAGNKNVGTGVGLNLTYSLVQLHHGAIWVEDNPAGSGAVFVVRIPLGRAHIDESELATAVEGADERPVHQLPESVLPPLDETLEPEEKKKAKSALRIMVVEDEDEVRKFIASELAEDYKVTECINGADAFEHVTKDSKVPDLIISDVMMPVMDGITLLDKLKRNILYNHIPVVLLTAKTHDEDRMEGLDSGADAYINKPFNIELLKSTVKNLLRTREMLRNKYRGTQDQAGKLDKVELQSSDEKLLARIVKVINREIANPNLNVEMITTEVGISRVHLHRKLKELTNQTTRDFIRNLRLKQAAELLESKDLNITDVALAVGFNNLVSFSVAFKAVYGMSPKEYMKSKHQVPDDAPADE